VNPHVKPVQIRDCREAAATKGWDVLDELIEVDEGKSGSTLVGRTGLQTLISQAQDNPRPFDCILVSDLARLGRSFTDLCITTEMLQWYGVYLYFADTGVDSRDKSFRHMVVQASLSDEIYRLSHAPLVLGCPCQRCEFRRVPAGGQ
jgi:DNA invertase Pin-like site-specific DNA recombinase